MHVQIQIQYTKCIWMKEHYGKKLFPRNYMSTVYKSFIFLILFFAAKK